MPLIPHFVPNVTLRDHVIPPVVIEVFALCVFLKDTEPVARFRLHLCTLPAVSLLTDWNLFLPGMLTRKLLTLLHETFPVCKQPLPYRSFLALGCLEFTLKRLVLTLKFLSRELACLYVALQSLYVALVSMDHDLELFSSPPLNTDVSLQTPRTPPPTQRRDGQVLLGLLQFFLKFLSSLPFTKSPRCQAPSCLPLTACFLSGHPSPLNFLTEQMYLCLLAITLALPT